MIQSWENVVTDRGSDGETDESEFLGPCPTNVERPMPPLLLQIKNNFMAFH